jgi:hypothetical protein
MTETISTSIARPASKTLSERIRVAWMNGGPKAATPRGDGRYLVTGRDGLTRYTVNVRTLDAIACDCAGGMRGRPCWHAAAAYLRHVADAVAVQQVAAISEPAANCGVTPLEGAMIRSLDGRSRTWLSFDRAEAGLPEVRDCDGCRVGVAELIVTDADEAGVSYEAVNGSAWDGRSREALCAACARAEAKSHGAAA